MHKPGDIVFAKVKGWSPWPAKIMCEKSPNLFKVFFYGTKEESLVKGRFISSVEGNLRALTEEHGTNKDFCHALEEMKSRPNIFVVDYDDVCDHPCLTCDQRRSPGGQLVNPLKDCEIKSMKNVRVNVERVQLADEMDNPSNYSCLNSMKNVRVNVERMKIGLNVKQERRKSRKKYNENSMKRNGFLPGKLYFLPPHSLKVKTNGQLKKLWNELGCSVCHRVFRSSLGVNVHKIEDHPELTAKDFIKKGTRKKKTMAQEDPELVTLESDSTLTDIDDLMMDSFSSFDNIEGLIKSSDNESPSYGNIEDLILSSDNEFPSSENLKELIQSSDSESANVNVDILLSSDVEEDSRQTMPHFECIDLCESE